jgi:hypothetical protein
MKNPKTASQRWLVGLWHRMLIRRLKQRLLLFPESISDASLKAVGISRRLVLGARSEAQLLRRTTIEGLDGLFSSKKRSSRRKCAKRLA